MGGVVLLVLANYFVWREIWGLARGLEVVFFDVEGVDMLCKFCRIWGIIKL